MGRPLGPGVGSTDMRDLPTDTCLMSPLRTVQSGVKGLFEGHLVDESRLLKRRWSVRASAESPLKKARRSGAPPLTVSRRLTCITLH